MKTKNAFVGNGNTVHIGIVEEDGTMRTVRCGAEFTRSQFSRMAQVNETTKEVTCKRCLKLTNLRIDTPITYPQRTPQ